MPGQCLLPDCSRCITAINTYSQDSYAKLIEVVMMLRELAQFCSAVGSPVSAIEHKQDGVTP
jgi:hypothetical protein